MTDWFSHLTGFHERSPDHVRANLTLEGTRLHSKVNGAAFDCGALEVPTLAELRGRVAASGNPRGTLRVSEVVADVQSLHADAQNAGAVFQVASQFNLLEMASPHVTPEQGVGIYSGDPTQGPACAIACGAGTIFRNYFVPVGDWIGQSEDRQIDCLADLGQQLGNHHGRLWQMTNGYALPTREGLEETTARMQGLSPAGLDELRSRLRVGVQSSAQVTLERCEHAVTQVYCAALPVAYCPFPASQWAPFAQLVLDAAYEATFCAAALSAAQTGNRTLFLTQLGGGAFGNAPDWIFAAIRRSLVLFRSFDLDVHLVSFRNPNPRLQRLLEEGF